MATRPEAVPLNTVSEEERMFIASQWKLMWWRFRRHKLAVAATALIGFFYFIALFSEFLAIHDPAETDSKRTFVKPQRVHFFDDWAPRPYVYMINAERNPETAIMEFEEDTSQKHYIKWFTRGHEYKLFGLLWKTDRHLMGVDYEGRHATFYPLGTDRMGRDMWSRIMYGTRISMSIGLLGVLISLVLGILLGGISGYAGRLDRRLDPAPHRVHPFHADDSAVAGAGGGGPSGLVCDQGLLRHHSHYLLHRVDGPGAAGARAVPGDEGGGLRHRGAAVRNVEAADHLPPHAPLLHEPHHRDHDAGDTRDHHRGDVPQLPRTGASALRS